MAEHGFRQQRVGDRRRVGQSRGLDHDAAKIRHLASGSPGQQIAQRPLQVAANRAAQTAVVEQQRTFGHALQQMMVEPDFAEFVHQNGDILEFRRSQEPLQQRGFPAAEKAGDDVDWR